MDYAAFMSWAFPASVLALAAVLWWGFRSLASKQDAMASQQNAMAVKQATIEGYIQTELRGMSVRIEVIERHLWPARGGNP